ncbi:MAG: TetR/AcrR family transcriptional regulator [Bacillota bacterium]
MKENALYQMTNSTGKRFYKDAFEKTSEDRRQKLFNVAVSEFAANGYNATNINVIAKKANVSIGAMYSYFASKEDLFLAIVEKGFQLLENVLKEVNTDDGDIFVIFERLLRASRDYALMYPELNQIYLDLTTQGLSFLSSRLSHKLESISAETYRNVIKKAKENGLISEEADEHIISFCLDNLIIMFQFSFTSDYYKERMRIFLGDAALQNEEEIIRGVMTFIKKALS